MFTPPVIVKLDVDTDTREFIKFLYRQSPEKQKLIIRTYPDLVIAVQQGEEVGGELVTNFVREQYRIQHGGIEILVKDMDKQVQTDGARVLEALGKVMGYSWRSDDPGYMIIPTLLPFSPFQQPIFFFSLVRFLRTNAKSVASDYGLTAVLAHEVSHFIFFDLLNQMAEETRKMCDKTIKHFAKEILAPVVMNDSRLDDILHLTNYGGNPFLRHITVRQGAEEQNIVGFFRSEYKHRLANGVPFVDFVSYLIDTLFSIREQIQKRHVLWSEYGDNLLSDEKLGVQYCEPIEIKAPR
jgi:hypothetical protein